MECPNKLCLFKLKKSEQFIFIKNIFRLNLFNDPKSKGRKSTYLIHEV